VIETDDRVRFRYVVIEVRDPNRTVDEVTRASGLGPEGVRENPPVVRGDRGPDEDKGAGDGPGAGR